VTRDPRWKRKIVIRLCIAQEQEALDNGVLSCADPRRLQQICDGLTGERFADPRTQSLWHALILFRLLPDGFRSGDLRRHLADLSGRSPDTLGQAAPPTSSAGYVFTE
jgi:hypothetical protein